MRDLSSISSIFARKNASNSGVMLAGFTVGVCFDLVAGSVCDCCVVWGGM